MASKNKRGSIILRSISALLAIGAASSPHLRAQVPEHGDSNVPIIVFDQVRDSNDKAMRYQDKDIYEIDLHKYKVRRVTNDHMSHSPAWSPTGERLAYLEDTVSGSEQNPKSFLSFSQPNVYYPEKLVVADAYGDQKEELAQLPGDAVGLMWSPDGTCINVQRSDWRNLLVYEAVGNPWNAARPFGSISDLVKSTNSSSRPKGDGPFLWEFYPPGDNVPPAVLFDWRRRTMDLSTRDVRAVLPYLRTSGIGGFTLAAFAVPDGHAVAPDIQAYDEVKSPDGRLIAYSSFVDPIHSVLYVAPSGDRTKRLALTKPDMDAHAPVWSPGGRRIAFEAIEGVTQRIFVVNADGSGLVSLSRDSRRTCSHPSWSPDGSLIVAACHMATLVLAGSVYLDRGGWYSSLFLFKTDESGQRPEILVNCGDNPYPGLMGLDLKDASSYTNRCGAHNPSFRPSPKQREHIPSLRKRGP